MSPLQLCLGAMQAVLPAVCVSILTFEGPEYFRQISDNTYVYIYI